MSRRREEQLFPWHRGEGNGGIHGDVGATGWNRGTFYESFYESLYERRAELGPASAEHVRPSTARLLHHPLI